MRSTDSPSGKNKEGKGGIQTRKMLSRISNQVETAEEEAALQEEVE